MESLQELWTLVSAALKDELSSVAFNSWISILKPVSLDNSTLTLSVRTLFQKGIVENNYLGEITSICEQIAGFPITVVLQSEQKLDPSAENGADDPRRTGETLTLAVKVIRFTCPAMGRRGARNRRPPILQEHKKTVWDNPIPFLFF